MCIRQTITDKIISILETGRAAGTCRWTPSAGQGMPRNAKTGQPYRGINVLLLWVEAAERGYQSNLWLTYKQAEGMGAQVRRGEKSTMCVFFDRITKESDDESDAVQIYQMAKAFFLFNVAQIDSLPESIAAPFETHNFNAIADAEQILIDSRADIRHGFDVAAYVPSKDQILLPTRERFTSAPNYYATALHELIHWTGHESRLNRQFGKRFGDDAYAFEELVAELGAAFAVGQLGMVDATIENHAAYVCSWVKVLKTDKQAIFTAASQASKASDFILSVPQTS
jgi:antirestriction protein ArdC